MRDSSPSSRILTVLRSQGSCSPLTKSSHKSLPPPRSSVEPTRAFFPRSSLLLLLLRGFGADQRPTRSARPVVVRMARRPLHGFVKMTSNASALPPKSPPGTTTSTLVIIVVLVVFIIAKGNHQTTLNAHVVQRQLPNRLLLGRRRRWRRR